MNGYNVSILLLLLTFALLMYLFATKDNPFIPQKLTPSKPPSKQGVINWFAWRGPMFVEDFGDIGYKPGNYSNGSPYETFDDQPDPSAKEPTESEAMITALEGFGNHTLPTEPHSCKANQYAAERKAKFLADHQKCHSLAYENCGPSNVSTSEKSYKHEYHNCSYRMRAPNPITGDLGNYKQCTNNSLDTPNQLKCVNEGRWDFDTCKPNDRVSHVCYKRNYDKCMKSLGHRNY